MSYVCPFPDPPVFGPSSCDISEDAGANGPCGAPLNATHTGVDVSLTYQIVGGTGASVFKVGQCDGQIRLRVSNSLDYNASSSYTLEIQAVPNGFTSSATTATITVNVLYVNKVGVTFELTGMLTIWRCHGALDTLSQPPVFNDAGVRSVFENQTALAPFGDPVSGT
jgi:Cadherin domain